MTRLYLVLTLACLLCGAACKTLYSHAPSDVCNWGGPSCEVTK